MTPSNHRSFLPIVLGIILFAHLAAPTLEGQIIPHLFGSEKSPGDKPSGGIVGGLGRAAKAMTGKQVPLRNQFDAKNGDMAASACGPAALAMALEYFGEKVPTDQLIKDTKMKKETGATVFQLFRRAFKSSWSSHVGWGVDPDDPMPYLQEELGEGGLVIVPINGKYGEGKETTGNHYVLVTDYKDGTVHINDPAGGTKLTIPASDFKNLWIENKPCLIVHGKKPK